MKIVLKNSYIYLFSFAVELIEKTLNVNNLYFQRNSLAFIRVLKNCVYFLSDKFSFKTCFKIFVVIYLSYQLFKLTIDYTEYNTVMDLRAENIKANYFSLTVCLRYKSRVNTKNKIIYNETQ